MIWILAIWMSQVGTAVVILPDKFPTQETCARAGELWKQTRQNLSAGYSCLPYPTLF